MRVDGEYAEYLRDYECIDVDNLFGYDQLWWEDALTRKSYTADFETTSDLDDCRVWSVAVCEVGGDEVWHGKTVSDFISWCERHAQCNVYFHNLGFDGAFIMDWLERNGWLWVDDRSKASDRSYTTCISDMNKVYCLDLYFTRAFSVRIMDSLKIVPLSVADMGRAYGLDVSKLSMDYAASREEGHELTEEERAYVDADVLVTSQVMRKFLDEGLNKMTAGSNALSDYRRTVGGIKGFRKWFPVLDSEDDAFVRKAYRGGFAYVNPRFANRVVGEGCVFDVNSLYPSVMRFERMPYGQPVWFDGVPKGDDSHDLWVAQVTCSFRIRDGHFPCIQLKRNFRFSQTEYLEYSHGQVTFNLTNVDWELINEQYHVYDVIWHGGFAFKSGTFLFAKYIDKWFARKAEATVEGNKGLRCICKLMLTSLYGKFGTRTEVRSRRPVLVDGVLRYQDLEPKEREPVYTPVAVFTTAYGRAKTVRAAQSCYERFLYADTDSIHLLGTEVPDGLGVDDVELGKWAHECDFEHGKYLRAKCYVEQEKGRDELTVHVAGLPSRCHSQVTLENFGFGAKYFGKLYQKRVEGGIVLVEGDMEIRR